MSSAGGATDAHEVLHEAAGELPRRAAPVALTPAEREGAEGQAGRAEDREPLGVEACVVEPGALEDGSRGGLREELHGSSDVRKSGERGERRAHEGGPEGALGETYEAGALAVTAVVKGAGSDGGVPLVLEQRPEPAGGLGCVRLAVQVHVADDVGAAFVEDRSHAEAEREPLLAPRAGRDAVVEREEAKALLVEEPAGRSREALQHVAPEGARVRARRVVDDDEGEADGT